MQIVMKPLGKIHRYGNNPRRNRQAVEGVRQSIRCYGFLVPILLDKNDVIIAGDTRYLAAGAEGMAEAPCIYAEGLTPEQVKAFRLVDNKTAEASTWDELKLSEELRELAAMDIDMSAYGFDMDSLFSEAARVDLSDKQFSVFEVVVECSGETELQAAYDRLTSEGYKCRLLTL